MSEVDVVLLLAALGALWWIESDEGGEDVDDDSDDLTDAREAYVEGEITHAEFEARAARELDPRAEEIRRAVEHVGGVGPETSAAIADEFDDVDEVRRADVDDLRRVHGVGGSTARAIEQELRI